jgi:hypothetical protein
MSKENDFELLLRILKMEFKKSNTLTVYYPCIKLCIMMKATTIKMDKKKKKGHILDLKKLKKKKVLVPD